MWWCIKRFSRANKGPAGKVDFHSSTRGVPKTIVFGMPIRELLGGSHLRISRKFVCRILHSPGPQQQGVPDWVYWWELLTMNGGHRWRGHPRTTILWTPPTSTTSRIGSTFPVGTVCWASSTPRLAPWRDRKSTRLNSSHANISSAVFCLNNNYPF